MSPNHLTLCRSTLKGLPENVTLRANDLSNFCTEELKYHCSFCDYVGKGRAVATHLRSKHLDKDAFLSVDGSFLTLLKFMCFKLQHPHYHCPYISCPTNYSTRSFHAIGNHLKRVDHSHADISHIQRTSNASQHAHQSPGSIKGEFSLYINSLDNEETFVDDLFVLKSMVPNVQSPPRQSDYDLMSYNAMQEDKESDSSSGEENSLAKLIHCPNEGCFHTAIRADNVRRHSSTCAKPSIILKTLPAAKVHGSFFLVKNTRAGSGFTCLVSTSPRPRCISSVCSLFIEKFDRCKHIDAAKLSNDNGMQIVLDLENEAIRFILMQYGIEEATTIQQRFGWSCVEFSPDEGNVRTFAVPFGSKFCHVTMNNHQSNWKSTCSQSRGCIHLHIARAAMLSRPLSAAISLPRNSTYCIESHLEYRNR